MNRVRIFGAPWDAPICEGAIVVDVAPGATCSHCGEAVVAGESGMVMGSVTLGENGEPVYGDAFLHRECALREVMGSKAHLEGRCLCHGGSDHDPPHLTARQAAQEVWDAIMGLGR